MEILELSTLINTGVVREGTKITILRKGKDLGGSDTVMVKEILEVASINKVDDEMILESFSTENGRRFNVKAKNIKIIDGMPVSRLISAHKSEGKKRGRKPKKRD